MLVILVLRDFILAIMNTSFVMWSRIVVMLDGIVVNHVTSDRLKVDVRSGCR